MKFKARKVTRANGEVELRLCLTLSADEAENAPKIADDDQVRVDVHRMATGERLDVYADQVLCWLRILVFWVAVWNDRENHHSFLVRSQGVRKARQRKPKRERKRRRR